MPALPAESDKAGESDSAKPDLWARAESEKTAVSDRPAMRMPATEAASEKTGEL